MKKSKILIIIILLIIILILVGVLQNDLESNNVSSNAKKFADSIIKKIDAGEELLIYFSNSDGTCDYCNNSIKFVEYFDDLYNLNVLYYDINKISKNDLVRFEEYYGFPKNLSIAPAVFYAKDGRILTGIMNVEFESSFIDTLLEVGFISADDIIELYANDENTFREVYSFGDNTLILLYQYSTDSYRYRKMIYNLGKKYNFNYAVVLTGFVDSSEIARILHKKYGDEYKVPSLSVVSSNKVIDYTTSDKEEEIVSFLKKNKIIR